jgi:uncharacterized protein (TIGR00296 family)
MYEDYEGFVAVKYSRYVISNAFKLDVKFKEKFTDKFNMKRGVFVTLNGYPSKELRGCIGYPEPVLPLKNALKDSALNAAFEDPRFEPLRKDELDHITIEVSLLTKPVKINKKGEDIAKEVMAGRDGLIVTKGFYRGLLLPQVATEYHWDVEEFLDQTCIKAGLSPKQWKEEGIIVEKFTAEIFYETSPNGKIIRL